MNDRQRMVFIKHVSTSRNPRAFRNADCSPKDFIDNKAADTTDVVEIGSRMLAYFCLDDREFNNNILPVTAAVAFLDELATGPSEAVQKSQCLKDLKAALESGNVDHIRQWAQANYS